MQVLVQRCIFSIFMLSIVANFVYFFLPLFKKKMLTHLFAVAFLCKAEVVYQLLLHF
jgi:hypothetical protein